MIIKRKMKAFVFVLAAFVALMGISAFAGGEGRVAHAENASHEYKIAVLSDTHYYPASYMADNAAFNIMLSTQPIMLAESGGILDAALKLVKADKPNVLLITGDLTNSGEYRAHEEVAAKLAAFENDTKVKVYVINGNTDINSQDSFDYSAGVKAAVAATTQEQFKTIYAKLGYEEAIAKFEPATGTMAGGLSYAARPTEGFTLLGIDTCKYSADATASGEDIPEDGGAISGQLLDWIKEQSGLAIERGDAVIAFQHHGLVNIFTEDSPFGDYVMSESRDVATAYADAKIELVFSSHMHANDIASFTSELGNTLYDIQTASLVGYPSSYRICTLTTTQNNDAFEINAQISTKYIGEVNYTNPLTKKAEKISNLTQYGKEKTAIDTDLVFSVANTAAIEAVDQLMEGGGVSAAIDEFVPEEMLAGMLNDLLVESLPTTKEEAIRLDEEGMFSAYYDLQNERITLILSVALFSGEVYIYSVDIIKLVKQLIVDFEEQYLKDFSYLSGQLYKLINNTMSHKFSGVSQDVEEIINFAYQGYLMGEETDNAWIIKVLAMFEQDEFAAIDSIINQVFKPIFVETLNHMLSNITVDLSQLLYDGDAMGKYLLAMITDARGSLGDLMELFGFSAETLAEMLVPMLFTAETKNSINSAVYDTLHALIYDSNYVEDNNTTIKIIGYSMPKTEEPPKEGGCACGTITPTSATTLLLLLTLCAPLLLLTRKRKTAH